MSQTETTADSVDAQEAAGREAVPPGASPDLKETYRRLWGRTKGPVVAGWWFVVVLFAPVWLLGPQVPGSSVVKGVGYGMAVLVALTLIAPLRDLLGEPEALGDVPAVLRRMRSTVSRAGGGFLILTFAILAALLLGIFMMLGIYRWLGTFGGRHLLRIGLAAIQWFFGTAALMAVYRFVTGAEGMGWLKPPLQEFPLAASASAALWGFVLALFWVGDLLRSGFAVFGSATAEMVASFARMTLICTAGFPILVAVVAVGATIERRTSG
jgi:hypothetical protein